ncbi:hypothetical protein RB608_21815 [Nocardioides sp. LHD-245]|uniref:hypothetical protein n=1 Tax=Nocardioides sp. LHD-245 TaxID=3051387 RepID=UPI0027DFB0C9|nr:hypothetical protein [Nocardioides sp. LHD-245]
MRTHHPARRLRARRPLSIAAALVTTAAALTVTGSLGAPAVADPPPAASGTAPLQTCTAEQVRASERNWIFGNNGGIDFGVSGTTATAVRVPGSTVEGSTVVSDTTGNLLFWSNGSTIFNRDNQVMPNGSGLLINASATQTVASFPSITNPGTYFVVTTTGASEVGGDGQLYYSKVDMSLDGGLGAVTSVKNVPLGGSDDGSEALTAVPNATGDGFWVLSTKANAPEILAFEFDGDGPVSGTAVASTLSTANGNQYGTLNISRDLSQVVQMTGSSTGRSQVRVLDVDGATGVLTEKFSWDLPTGSGTGSNGYSADFSPEGDYVYATKIFGGAHLFRYRLDGAATSADVAASVENLSGIGNGGQVRRAPDGRMYVANRAATTLSVVNTPDATDPGLVIGGFPLAAGVSNSWGLPQTVTGCPKPPNPPVVEVEGPGDGEVYFEGQEVPAAYSCTSPDSTIASCEGPVPDGENIDTSTPGEHEFTVTGTDDKGLSTTTKVTYKVVATVGLCRGTPLSLLNLTPGTANPATSPCATDDRRVLRINERLAVNPGLLGGLLNPLLRSTVSTGVLTGTTTTGAGLATATATVDNASVSLPGLVTLTVSGVHSEARSQLRSCVAADVAGSSHLATLTLNGKTIAVGDKPLTIPLVVGSLSINQQVRTGNTVTQRAVFLDLPGNLLDIAIGESTAGVVCGG